jgi:hypothetical protein
MPDGRLARTQETVARYPWTWQQSMGRVRTSAGGSSPNIGVIELTLPEDRSPIASARGKGKGLETVKFA